MADEQQDDQQQNMLDAQLVPIDDQVKIGMSNFRIALERNQSDVIYKVCLEILNQYSFFNAFIATADALEIYMPQFLFTVVYDLTAKAHFFKLDDQIFEVNVDLLRKALQITLKDPDHPFTLPTLEKEIIFFINELGCSKTSKTVSTLRTNYMYQPWRTLLTMMNKCLVGKSTTYDRQRLPI
ncbi:hypothetical protein Tco_0739284 [Tanacetum coccineum]